MCCRNLWNDLCCGAVSMSPFHHCSQPPTVECVLIVWGIASTSASSLHIDDMLKTQDVVTSSLISLWPQCHEKMSQDEAWILAVINQESDWYAIYQFKTLVSPQICPNKGITKHGSHQWDLAMQACASLWDQTKKSTICRHSVWSSMLELKHESQPQGGADSTKPLSPEPVVSLRYR